MKSHWICLFLMFISTISGEPNLNVPDSSVIVDKNLIMKMQHRLEYLEDRDQAYRKELQERDQLYRREIDALLLQTKSQQDQIDKLLASEKTIEEINEKNIDTINSLRRRVENQDEQIVVLLERLQKWTEPDVTSPADAIPDEMSSKAHAERKTQRQRRAVNEFTVGFTATLSKSLTHVGANQDIVFDRVITNVGNAYNSHHGLFVAPVSGLYVFSFTIAAYHDDHHVNLVVNGQKVIGSIVRAIESTFDANGPTVVLLLNANDDVAIQNLDPNDNMNGYSVFSGFLLQQTYSTSTIVGK